MGQCGTMTGGRHRKGHKTRKSRRGGGYGFGQPISVGTLEVVKNSTSQPYSSATGAAIPDPYATNGNSSTLMGGRRRKSRKGKSKKGGKKSRKTRTRKMRGGMYGSNGVVNSAGAGYGFSGATSGVTSGIAPATGYASRVGGAPMGADGVRSA